MNYLKALFLSLALLATGCARQWDIGSAQRALTAGADIVQATDEVVAPAIRSATASASTETLTREEFVARMAPWGVVANAVASTRSAFRAAQFALDAWRLGSSEDWLGAASCLYLSVEELVGALQTAGVAIPEEMLSWLGLFGNFARVVCTQE